VLVRPLRCKNHDTSSLFMFRFESSVSAAEPQRGRSKEKDRDHQDYCGNDDAGDE